MGISNVSGCLGSLRALTDVPLTITSHGAVAAIRTRLETGIIGSENCRSRTTLPGWAGVPGAAGAAQIQARLPGASVAGSIAAIGAVIASTSLKGPLPAGTTTFTATGCGGLAVSKPDQVSSLWIVRRVPSAAARSSRQPKPAMPLEFVTTAASSFSPSRIRPVRLIMSGRFQVAVWPSFSPFR